MDKSLEQEVWRRAKNTCEYCRMPQAFYRTRHQIDHIIAEQHRGPTSLENLALACLPCNNHKGPNLSGIDPVSQKMVRLYHPRRDKWGRHFSWDGPRLVGKTPIGRATIEVLAINHPDSIAVRESLIAEGVFPA
jgi:hypothetical protein